MKRRIEHIFKQLEIEGKTIARAATIIITALALIKLLFHTSYLLKAQAASEMPNRVKRNSGTLDLLAKVPVNKGSLLKSIDNLLKTIESSENSVMIPTLLRDKCEFDAWELLFVAKILKASILGHTDLVEFYMNHIGLPSSQFSSQQQQQQQWQQYYSAGNGGGGNGSCQCSNYNGSQQDVSLSPSQMMRMMPSPTSVSSSPSLVAAAGEQPLLANNGSPARSQQSSSVNSWVTASNSNSSSNNQNGSNGAQTTTSYASCTSGALSSAASTSASGDSVPVAVAVAPPSPGGADNASSCSDSTQQTPSSGQGGSSVQQAAAAAAAATEQANLLQASRPVMMRQAQPPSLLQLTTNNNHINSVAAIGSSSSAFTNSDIEQLTNQLTAMQQSGCLSTSGNSFSTTTTPHSGCFSASDLSPQFGGDRSLVLSISTSAANQGATAPAAASSSSSSSLIMNNNNNNSTGISPSILNSQGVNGGQPTATATAATTTTTTAATTAGSHLAPASVNGNGSANGSGNGNGLSTSRSAGCIFRLNSSGGSSPRTPLQTPTTPYPQAETLANGLANGFPGDPSAPVKLLLQIEQLKSSISHVTKLLDSVVELYKKSIDNIAMA